MGLRYWATMRIYTGGFVGWVAGVGIKAFFELGAAAIFGIGVVLVLRRVMDFEPLREIVGPVVIPGLTVLAAIGLLVSVIGCTFTGNLVRKD